MNENAKKPILSFCIVTRRNPERVRALLETLIPQAVPDEMEIIIRDDSPENAMRLIVEEFSKRFPIRYFHGKKLGIDGANYFMAQEARGDYLWWFGDDILASGAIHHIIRVLKKHPEITFMWVNSANENNPANPNDAGLNWGPSRFLKDGNEVLEEIADFLGYLSALIFKREVAILSYDGAKKWIGSGFAGLHTIFYVLSEPGAKAYYMAERYILGRPNLPEDQFFFDGFQMFGVTFYKMLKEFEGRFGHKSIKRCLAKNFSQVWRGILVYRARGLKTNFGADTVRIGTMFKLYWSFRDFWIALPFLLLPKPIERMCYKAYKALFPKTINRFEKRKKPTV